jgi:glycosyltransferase involved in cell wall biosynthesis
VARLTGPILLVTPHSPVAGGDHGGVRAVHGLAMALAGRVDLLLVHPDTEPPDAELIERCADVRPYRVRRALPTWERRVSDGYGLARGRSIRASGLDLGGVRHAVNDLVTRHGAVVVQAEYAVLGDALRAVGRERARRVVTIHDPARSLVDALRRRGRAAPLVEWVDAAAAIREERRALRLADAAVVFSQRDRAQLSDPRGRGAEIVTIPLGWDVPLDALDPLGTGDRPTVLFVGNFRHPPNVEAAMRLAMKIHPLVVARRPDVLLEIVGPGPPDALRALASDSIRVTGRVAAVVEHLDRAAVVVAPLELGGGTRVKVLEALAAGKAVVASSRAVEGTDAASADAVIVADGSAATAAAVVSLLDDPTRRAALSRAARRWALQTLSWGAMADSYVAVYERLIARAERTGPR